ncbi:hypothetical protein GCM10009760_16440 [Kitasatospora kazusensis]|uniref:Uncharacterized protein n=1 Tax=Kitasatospora kazusensis TaxID=407974 RepID=A0ABN2Z4P6_9ACTN
MHRYAEERQVELSRDLVGRLARLPDGWQVEVIRRIADGVMPLHALTDAGLSINVLHHVFRVPLAWNAKPLRPLPEQRP